MRKEALSLQLRPRYITGLIDNIQKYFEQESDVKYPAEVIDDALQTWLESRFDHMLEGLGEVITSPHLAESQHFRRILEERATDTESVRASSEIVAEQPTEVSVFTGARKFSPDKLGAMIEYIAERGQDIYKTNLNKLLFYGDLTFYYLYGRGISGATYVNLPYGPVPRAVETVLDSLGSSNRIRKTDAPDKGTNAQMIEAVDGVSTKGTLSDQETELLDWVLDTYGEMSPGQITEYSHSEKAYKFTRPQEPIAYEYAKFFQKLPPR